MLSGLRAHGPIDWSPGFYGVRARVKKTRKKSLKNRVFAVLAIESSVAWELQFWSQALEFRVNMRNFCSQASGCRR